MAREGGGIRFNRWNQQLPPVGTYSITTPKSPPESNRSIRRSCKGGGTVSTVSGTVT